MKPKTAVNDGGIVCDLVAEPAPTPDPLQIKVVADSITEITVIGTLLKHPDLMPRVMPILHPDHFISKAGREAYEVLQEIERRKMTFDEAAVRTIAHDTKLVKFIIECGQYASDVNIDKHISTLHWDALRLTAR